MNNVFTEKDFDDLKMYLEFAHEYVEEYFLYTNEAFEHYKRIDELKVILHDYINKPIGESPE